MVPKLGSPSGSKGARSGVRLADVRSEVLGTLIQTMVDDRQELKSEDIVENFE